MSLYEQEDQHTVKGQCAKLNDQLAMPNLTPRQGRALAEALYTNAEANSEASADPDDAIRMWAIVEWARTASDSDVESIRL